jgi:glycosidase
MLSPGLHARLRVVRAWAPRSGNEDDLLELIERASVRGVRVLLDGVFNHVGRGFPAFVEVAAHGQDSRYASWFRGSALDQAAGIELGDRQHDLSVISSRSL